MEICINKGGEAVRVVLVSRQQAKQIKNRLEKDGKIQRDFRMCAAHLATPLSEMKEDLVAIPIISDESYEQTVLLTIEGVHQFGVQNCPYSSALLGNGNLGRRLCNSNRGSESYQQPHLNTIQTALVRAISNFLSDKGTKSGLNRTSLIEKVTLLSPDICPTKLELLGDDRTVVIPMNAFHNAATIGGKNLFDPHNSSLSFPNFLDSFEASYDMFTKHFLWREIADTYRSRRVVRRGEIDPNSPVRKGNYEILWVAPNSFDTMKFGPNSQYWITVTEQGIRQSFDLTRVMFSRGNISEKIRFGALVQEDEIVLDMYAGIGYFTLPALIHGKASQVYCCEWNIDAVEALRYNLFDNNVHTRAIVMEGDCRRTILERGLYNMFDRVSLGILPSSEGGWETAVRALRRDKGGWLHVHGNVPRREVHQWALWLCSRLKKYVCDHEDEGCEWITLIAHIENVKSFAPNVNHYVADVFLGRPSDLGNGKMYDRDIKDAIATLAPGSAGIWIVKDGNINFCAASADVEPPSCALSSDGVLHQAWMSA